MAKGNIYPTGKNACPTCGGKFKHHEPDGIWCPDHPDQRPKGYQAQYGRGTNQRFESYVAAYNQLCRWRAEDTDGMFDARNYKADSPLKISQLAEDYIHHKRTVKSVKIYERHLRFAVRKFGDRKFLEVTSYMLEDLLVDMVADGYAPKYCHDVFTTLREFWKWAPRANDIKSYDPDRIQFPHTEPTMALSDTFRDKDQQIEVLDWIREHSTFNPRIYVAARFMATYINCRPAEIMGIREQDIRWQTGQIYIPHPKEKNPKFIDLLPEDLDILRQLREPNTHPTAYVFRHVNNRHGNATTGQKWGKTYMWRWFKKACDALGYTGISLYPGTRHSSAKALIRQGLTPDQIIRTTGHDTRDAFMRYLTVDEDERLNIFAETTPARPARPVLDLATYRKRANSPE